MTPPIIEGQGELRLGDALHPIRAGDTGRFGLLAEMPGAADGKPRELRFMGRAGESLGYWQGE